MGKINSRRRSRRLINRITIFVDGRVEQDYLNHININSNDNVSFDIKIGTENEYLKKKEDELVHMIILDVDATTKKNDPKKRYLNLAQIQNDENVFYNNYSFETFLLMHIIDFSRPIFHKKEYDSFMKQNFALTNAWSKNKNEENKKKILLKINDISLKKAILKAESSKKTFFENPSTNMHKFFKKIEDLSNVDSE